MLNLNDFFHRFVLMRKAIVIFPVFSCFFLFFPVHVNAVVDINSQSPEVNRPVEVRLTLNVNKIYDVNPVNQTYSVDAYLTADWKDLRVSKLVDGDDDKLILEDEGVDDIRKEIWIPSFEIINISEPKEVGNKRVFIYKNGKVVYTERFRAVMTGEMKFKKFPFDTQIFKVIIEPFSYSSERLVFNKNSKLYPVKKAEWPMDEWKVVKKKTNITNADYEFLYDVTGEKAFSNINFSITVERIPNYFICQVMIPLFIIMMCAWCVYFVDDSSTRLSLISTLMLTVYAFNFFVSDSIPKLPYSTFLGDLIVISFFSIFIQFVFHVVQANSKWVLTNFHNSMLVSLFFLGFVLSASISWFLSGK